VAAATPDPDLTNNSQMVTTNVSALADVSVTKTIAPGPVVAGTTVTYTITVANAGPSDAQMMDVYETVLRAQEAALALVRPGQDCQEVHETARRVIGEAGYGEFFNHGTGHGVGIENHEEPRFRNGFLSGAWITVP